MTISVELARGVHGITAELSHESVYAALYAHGRRLATGPHKHLHRQRRCRKRRLPPGEARVKAGPLGVFNPPTDRPGAAEGMWLADMPEGHGADATLAALIELVERIPPELRRSLTWDGCW